MFYSIVCLRCELRIVMSAYNEKQLCRGQRSRFWQCLCRRRIIQIVCILTYLHGSAESTYDSHHPLGSYCRINSKSRFSQLLEDMLMIWKDSSWSIWKTLQYNAVCKNTCVIQESSRVTVDPVIYLCLKFQRNIKQACECPGFPLSQFSSGYMQSLPSELPMHNSFIKPVYVT